MGERNFIDYFAVCGLDVKMGLELEQNEAYGRQLPLLATMKLFLSEANRI